MWSSLCLIKHNTMKTFWCGGMAPHILKFKTGYRPVANFTLQTFYPKDIAPSTHLIVDWVLHRAHITPVEFPPGTDPNSPVIQLIHRWSILDIM